MQWAFSPSWIGVCEQTIASLVATVAARTEVVSMSAWITETVAFLISKMELVSTEKVCGNIDDCGPVGC